MLIYCLKRNLLYTKQDIIFPLLLPPPPPPSLSLFLSFLDLALTGVAPATLESSGEWVTVTWSGVANPSKQDMVALFVANGTTVDIKKHGPIKFQVNY